MKNNDYIFGEYIYTMLVKPKRIMRMQILAGFLIGSGAFIYIQLTYGNIDVLLVPLRFFVAYTCLLLLLALISVGKKFNPKIITQQIISNTEDARPGFLMYRVLFLAGSLLPIFVGYLINLFALFFVVFLGGFL